MPKKKIEPADGRYFIIGKQFPGEATCLGFPGDAGILIPADRFQVVPRDRFDRLVRLYGLAVHKGKKKFDCGKCGAFFSDEYSRDAHGRRRHGKRTYVFRDLQDLSEEQRQIIKAEAGEPNLRPGDPGYSVDPMEFHVPDPSDRETAQMDREIAQSIPWDKTAASMR